MPTGWPMRDAYTVAGPAGALAVRAHGPVGSEPPVLLCHPHPLHGGSMGSRLVYDLATGLADEGWRAYRFDYRGVGQSEGDYGQGLGEAADTVALLEWIGKAYAEPPVVIGHSFGGGVALRAAARHPVGMVILIGTPAAVRDTDLDPVADAARVSCPVVQIRGSEDEHVSPDDVTRLHAVIERGTVVELSGAGHFLEPSRNGDALRAVQAALLPMRRPARP